MALTGIVDHRFDHIDSGRLLSLVGPRAYFRFPSSTCTQRPNTPASAKSRMLELAPVTSGTIECPCVRCVDWTSNTSINVA